MALRRATNRWCFLGNAVLGVWLAVLTALLVLCHTNTLHSIDKLDATLDNLTDVFDPLANCCDELHNCTCQDVPGLSVECWDANTNTPQILSGVAPANDTLFVVCTPGNTTIDGTTNWQTGDYLQWVPEEFAWLANRAAGGTGVAIDRFNLNWTCDIWETPTVEAAVTMLEIMTDWYIVHVEGVVQNSSMAGQCNITSSPMPTQYQYNNSFPDSDRRIVFTVGFREDFGPTPGVITEFGLAILDDRWTIWNFIPQQNRDLQIPFVANASGEPVGFWSFDRLYTTNPVAVAPFDPNA